MDLHLIASVIALVFSGLGLALLAYRLLASRKGNP